MQNTYKRKVIVAVSVIAALALTAGLVLFKKPWLTQTKDRMLEVLHLQKKVNVKGDTETLHSNALLERYYKQYGYTQTWSDRSEFYRTMLISMLNYADSLGLDPKNYHQDYIEKYDSLITAGKVDLQQFETENELIFSDAAMSFLFDVAYGKEIDISFNGVKYNIDTAHILNMYSDLMLHKNWRRTLDSIEPRIPQYVYLKTQLNRMNAFLKDFPEADTLTVGNSEAGLIAASVKLNFYGLVTDSLVGDSSDALRLSAAIKGFQKMMNIDTSGKLDTKTTASLNRPLASAMRQMKESLNYWRWTGRLNEHEFILVNIPAARLQIVNPDSAKDLSMRVIVGKTSTQTPSFTAYITKVITYPYWNVPNDIAVKEMLPKIQKSLDYLEANNLQVLDNRGKELDPTQIKWKTLTPARFPYRIRQSTGCDNALGVLKFDLNSPYFIYLHDTNRRDLFTKKDRFMSHGCVRLEKPMELANYVLQDGLDSATVAKLNQCLRDEKPTSFALKKQFPVLILYLTADVDENGWLRFYNDVYKLDEEKKAAERKAV